MVGAHQKFVPKLCLYVTNRDDSAQQMTITPISSALAAMPRKVKIPLILLCCELLQTIVPRTVQGTTKET